MELHDAAFGILLLYGTVISGSMFWSLTRGKGHTFGWWDGGNLMKGKTFSVRETVLALVLTTALIGVGLYYWLQSVH